jgi:hypothetical protein
MAFLSRDLGGLAAARRRMWRRVGEWGQLDVGFEARRLCRGGDTPLAHRDSAQILCRDSRRCSCARNGKCMCCQPSEHAGTGTGGCWDRRETHEAGGGFMRREAQQKRRPSPADRGCSRSAHKSSTKCAGAPIGSWRRILTGTCPSSSEAVAV